MTQIVGYFSNGNPIYKDDLTKQSVYINCDFRHSRLSELDLKSISFFQCDFTSASLRESKFTDVVFNACVLDNIDAYSTQFIDVELNSVSMKSSLLTKSTFLVKKWSDVDLSYSKIFDMDMQETKDSGSCILGYQYKVLGQPIRLLDGWFTVAMDTPDAIAEAKLFNRHVNRITNSRIEEELSKSKKISESPFRFLKRILVLGIGQEAWNDEYLKNFNYGWLQKRLDKIRKDGLV